MRTANTLTSFCIGARVVIGALFFADSFSDKEEKVGLAVFMLWIKHRDALALKAGIQGRTYQIGRADSFPSLN